MVIFTIVLASFVVALVLVASTRLPAVAIAGALPVAAAACAYLAIVLSPSTGSTAPVAVPLVILFVAFGSVSGAVMGAHRRSARAIRCLGRRGER